MLSHAALPGQSLFLLNAPDALFSTTPVTVVLALPVIVGLGILGLWRTARANLAVLPWLLFPLAYTLAYSAAGFRGVRMFHWYLVPLLPFYALFLAAGVRAVMQARWLRAAPALRWLPVALLLAWWVPGLVSAQQVGYPIGFTDARERLYHQIAVDYQDQWRENTLLALPEIGAMGYYSRSEVLDTVGLVSPVALNYYPIPNAQLFSDNAVPVAMIKDLQPDYVVTLDIFILGTLISDPWFQEHYELVEQRDVQVWTSKAILVYRRSDLGPLG
jgi:hypothetical protein